MKSQSVKYALKKEIFDTGMNSNTVRTYGRAVDDFASWCDARGMHHVDQVKTAGAVETVRAYCSDLIDKGYSPSTIHTKLAPVCKGLGVGLGEIDNKPRRTADKISRGRNPDANVEGRHQLTKVRFSRVVGLEEAIGVRKSELYHLKGRNLVYDESGALCVEVEKGKGGKHQLQRILPGKEDQVIDAFAGVKSDDYVFSKEETYSKINIHGIRAQVQREAYDFYAKAAKDPATRETMRKELVARYDACNDSSRPGARSARAHFLEDVKSDTPYRLRGAVKATAEQNGRPVVLDRLAVLYVSVFFGSHWRLEVEVSNYLCT